MSNWVYSLLLLSTAIPLGLAAKDSNQKSNTVRPSNIWISEKHHNRCHVFDKVYETEDVTVYLNVTLDKKSVNWAFRVFTNTWVYLIKTYPSLLKNSNLHLTVIFRGVLPLRGKSSRTCKFISHLTVCNESHQNFPEESQVVECGHSNRYKVASSQNAIMTTFESKLQQLISTSLNNTSYNNFEYISNLFAVSGVGSAASILHDLAVFDLYFRMGMVRNASEIFVNKQQVRIANSTGKFWLLHWYLPIYINYGGASVLDKFISFSQSKAVNEGGNKTTSIGSAKTGAQLEENLGEFVYTWSEAARHDLKNMAKKTFDWKQENEEQFQLARNKAETQNFMFPCDDCTDDGRDEGANTKNDTEIAVIIVLGVLVSVVVIGAIGFGMKKVILKNWTLRKINAPLVQKLTARDVQEFHNGNPFVHHDDAHAPIHMLPFDSSYEISEERIKITENKVLGTGEYGKVLHGMLKADPECQDEDVEVAIKIVKPDVEVTYFKALLSEIKIMAYLGQHDNIVSLLGASTVNIENCQVFVAMELCAKGDLLRYIKKFRRSFHDMWNKRTTMDCKVYFSTLENDARATILSTTSSDIIYSGEMPQISTHDLLEWSLQIANGMAYLSSKKVIHGDLAARNVLLDAFGVAKICDFGLSRQLIHYSNYMKSTSTPLPFRWMAIESLNYMSFSVHSDIWAFGVTLWEIFTLGKIPFPGRSWDDAFILELEEGQRLHSPDFGNQEIYSLMLDCWKYEPVERITFPDIVLFLGNVKERLKPLMQPLPAVLEG